MIRVLPGKMESFFHLFVWRLSREAKMAHSAWPTWKKVLGTSDGDKSIWREEPTCYKVRKFVSVWSKNPFRTMSGLSPPARLHIYTQCPKWHNSYLIINYWRETEEQCEISGGNKHERQKDVTQRVVNQPRSVFSCTCHMWHVVQEAFSTFAAKDTSTFSPLFIIFFS